MSKRRVDWRNGAPSWITVDDRHALGSEGPWASHLTSAFSKHRPQAQDWHAPRNYSGIIPLALSGAILLAHAWASWLVPFLNEDYSFLDLARRMSFFSIWASPELYTGPWLRPWSQGLHYWVLQKVFGTQVFYWHIVSWVLALIAVSLFLAFVRRLSGYRVAGIASVSNVAALRVRDWRIGDVRLPATTVVEANLPFGNADGGVQGLIGSDMLSRFDVVTIDYQHEQLRLHPRG